MVNKDAMLKVDGNGKDDCGQCDGISLGGSLIQETAFSMMAVET